MQKNIPTYVEIYEDYYSKIINGQYKEGDKLPTEAEICKQYYVSRITVQKALQKLVKKGLIIRISGKGTFVSLGNKKPSTTPNAKVGLVLCDFGVSYGINLIRSIEKELEKHGKSLILKNSYFKKERESAAIVSLLEQDVEGIILQPTHNDYFNTEVLKLSLNKYPMVIIDRDLKGINLPYVGTDNIAGTLKAMDYLFSQGHRNICFMSAGPKNTSTLEERIEAFHKSYINHNYPNNNNNVFIDIISPTISASPESIRTDIEKIKEHILNNPQVTCIFTGEYAVCSLVKQALKELGKKIPDDMSIITYDNINDPFFFTNTAYVKQNEAEIGKRAVELLLSSLQEDVSEAKLYLSSDLVINHSIKNLNE